MPDPGVTWKISGLDDLQKKFEELPRKVARQGLNKALNAGGEVIQDAIVAAAPEATGFMKQHFGRRIKLRSGDLAGSVFVGPEGKIDYPPRQLMRVFKGLSKKAMNVLLKSGGRIAVASVVRFMEFGTSRMAKKPFMTQAAQNSSSSAVEAVVKSLKETIEGP